MVRLSEEQNITSFLVFNIIFNFLKVNCKIENRIPGKFV